MNVRAAWSSLSRHDDWNCGWVAAPIAAFLEPGFAPEVHWLAGRRDRYVADPFALPHHLPGDTLCEAYDFRRGRGQLATGDGRALEGFPDHHLSYPFLLQDQGRIYCLPEAWQSGQVTLYEAVEFPLRWRQAAVLLADFPGVDATVFEHGGAWWLAATREFAAPMRDLWLFHAPRLQGPWAPHARNPVKSDLGGARPGGTPFVHQGRLYRPGQDCRHTYGGAVVIHRVEELTPERFEEQAVARIAPQPAWPWNGGLHTLAAAGPVTWLDAKRSRFERHESLRNLRRMLRAG